jgi:hypothetical protein
VPAFATLAAGFCVARLGLNPAPPNTLIHHNVAPRKDDGEARAGSEGERLSFARLPNGVRVVGVNAGYAFSFVRDAAGEPRWISVPAGGSRFRSRDPFPQAAGEIVAGSTSTLAGQIGPSAIPEVPEDRVAYADGYGRPKTTVQQDALAASSGARPRVRIGGTERRAIVSDGTFNVEEGGLAFAPGSGGWPGADGEPIRWRELFLRGGSAWEVFGRPEVGAGLEYATNP